MGQDDQERLEQTRAKILEYYENPRISARLEKLYEKIEQQKNSLSIQDRLASLQVQFETIGTIEASFSAAEFYSGEIESAVKRLNKSVAYQFSNLRSSFELWRIRSVSRILDHPTASVLSCLCVSQLLGYSTAAKWIARKVPQSYDKQEHWALSGGYLSEFLRVLAEAISNGIAATKNVSISTPEIINLVTAESSEVSRAFTECASYRFSEAHRVQTEVLEEDFLDYALAGMPLELLVFREIYKKDTGETLSTSHPVFLPVFEEILGARSAYSDEYITEMQQLTLEFSGEDISIQ